MNIKTKPTEVFAQAATDAQTVTDRVIDRASDGVRQGAATFAAATDKAQGHVQGQMKDGVARAMWGTEQMMAFAQGNVEAFVKSGQLFGAGLQELGRRVADHARASVDEAMNATRTLSGVKSVKEMYDLQGTWLRDAAERTVTEAGKLTEHSIRVAEQASAPLTARFNAAVEAFGVRV